MNLLPTISNKIAQVAKLKKKSTTVLTLGMAIRLVGSCRPWLNSEKARVGSGSWLEPHSGKLAEPHLGELARATSRQFDIATNWQQRGDILKIYISRKSSSASLDSIRMEPKARVES